MKPVIPLLAVSVAANLALIATVWLRQPASNTGTSSDTQVQAVATGIDSSLRAALASGDAAALAAAGCPPEIARALAVGRAYHRQQERLRALRAPVERNARFWRAEPSMSGASRLELMKIQQDYQEEIAKAGEVPQAGLDGRVSITSFLPAEKQEKLRRIQRDYAEMNNEVRAESGNLRLPSDQERLNLLEAEYERDVAALLGPRDYAQYQMRLSHTTDMVRSRYGNVINSEEEFNAIYALQKSFEDQFDGRNPPGGSNPAARFEAEGKLQQDVAALLGPERVHALLRDTDPDFRTLTGLTQRLGLPTTTPEEVYAMRDVYAAQSVQISANTDLSDSERSAQLKALAARAQLDLERMLGVGAAQVAVDQFIWLQTLKHGTAFSTTPPSSYPLSPAVTIIRAPHK